MNTGVWLVASAALRRPVDGHEIPYPHVCGERAPTRRGEVRLGPMHCAACGVEAQHQREATSQTPPPTDDDVRALEARRLGERNE